MENKKHRKILRTVVCVAAALIVIGIGVIVGARVLAKNAAIGNDRARDFAFADAGISAESAQNVATEFEFARGQFVYDVGFSADGAEYDYKIRASDGSVVSKEVERIGQDGAPMTVSAQITLDDAKEIALADAGIDAANAAFSKEKLDLDNGVSVYEFEFFAAGVEYDYEIDAATGAIHSKSSEKPENPPTAAPAASDPQNPVDLEAAKAIALADAGVTEADVTFTQTKQDYDDGVSVYDIEFLAAGVEYDYEIDAATGAIRSRSSEKTKNPSTAAPNDGGNPANQPAGSASGSGTAGYIELDRAKSIAAEHAGFAVADVTFYKAKLDHEDGRMVYEIEFYSGDMEYEYTIDALSGDILEYDAEHE